MSRKFSGSLSEREKVNILKNLREALKFKGIPNLEAYLAEYYDPGEFSGSNLGRQRRFRIKKLDEIQFTKFIIDFAEDLGISLDYIFCGLGPPAPSYRIPKPKK
jgi:hypothetical protein